MGFFATKICHKYGIFLQISHQNMGQIWEKIPNKCIQMGHASKVDHIEGQSITEPLFMNEYKNLDYVVIYKHFELIFWFSLSLYLQINCL